MNTPLWIVLSCWWCQALLAALAAADEPPPAPAPAAAEAEGPISVVLAGGRTFTADLDPQTAENLLWLRWQGERITVRRAIPWERVIRAEVAGASLTGDALRELVAEVRREIPAPAVEPPRGTIVLCGAPAEAEPSPAEPPPDVPPVRSLEIEAVAANWDDDVEADGLLLRVYPLDAQGQFVPVRATLEIDLTVQRPGVRRVPGPFYQAGRWVESLAPEQFGFRGAELRLPFQSVDPEFDANIAAYGAVHARLSVPGQGTFDATLSTVRIRPFSPVRDRWQQASGQRFFPQERTGDGRR